MQGKVDIVVKYKEVKHEKYNNNPNVIPLAIETMQAVGPAFKKYCKDIKFIIITYKFIFPW